MTTPDTSGPMDNEHVQGTKGRSKKGKKGKGKEKGKGRARKTTVNTKGTRGQTIPILLASAGIVASWDTRKLSVGGRRRTKEANFQLQQFKQLQQ